MLEDLSFDGDTDSSRPMGCGAAMVTKPEQSANEIVLEMVVEAFGLLRAGGQYLNVSSKL